MDEGLEPESVEQEFHHYRRLLKNPQLWPHTEQVLLRTLFIALFPNDMNPQPPLAL